MNEPAASPLTEKPFTVIGAMPWFDSVIVREAGAAFCGSGSGKTRLDGSATSGPPSLPMTLNLLVFRIRLAGSTAPS